MKTRSSILLILIGAIGIINLLFLLQKIFLTGRVFFFYDQHQIFHLFVYSICRYGDSDYIFRDSFWSLIYNFKLGVVSVVAILTFAKMIQVKDDLSIYLYIRTNMFVAAINAIVTSLILTYLIYFLKLYTISFLVRLVTMQFIYIAAD